MAAPEPLFTTSWWSLDGRTKEEGGITSWHAGERIADADKVENTRAATGFLSTKIFPAWHSEAKEWFSLSQWYGLRFPGIARSLDEGGLREWCGCSSSIFPSFQPPRALDSSSFRSPESSRLSAARHSYLPTSCRCGRVEVGPGHDGEHGLGGGCWTRGMDGPAMLTLAAASWGAEAGAGCGSLLLCTGDQQIERRCYALCMKPNRRFRAWRRAADEPHPRSAVPDHPRLPPIRPLPPRLAAHPLPRSA